MTTVKDHMNASEALKQQIDAADALAKKLAHVLNGARSTIEALKVYAPDKRFKIDAPYHLRSSGNGGSELSMNEIILKQIEVINATLGDRADV